jgi:teichuronic acid exporter
VDHLKSKSVSSAKWSLILQLGQYLITFSLSIVLSRLLEPAEFGLTGMLSIFIAMATTLTSAGLGQALVFNKNSTDADYSTVFYFNILVSSILYLILFFSAPLIAAFFNQPELIQLTRWICLVFVINAFGLIQDTLLVIDLNFKKQSLIRLVSLLISVVAAIIMAFRGFGVYSIVGQVITQALSNVVLYWILSTWRPKTGFSIQSFKKLWKYSSNILFSNLFSQIIDNIDNILVGKIFMPHTLGLFIRAKSTKAIPEGIFTQAFQTSVFPILTKLNENKDEFVRKHLQFFKIGAYFVFPLVLMLYFSSYEIVDVLYGSKWHQSIPYLKILSFMIIPYFLGILFNQTLLAFGDSRLFMTLNMLRKFLGIINIPVAIFWGLIPYLYSIVILSFIGLLFDIIYTSKKIGTNILDYSRDFLLALVFSILLGTVILSAENWIPAHVYVAKSIGFALGISIYLLLLKTFRPQVLGYFIDIARSFVRRE